MAQFDLTSFQSAGVPGQPGGSSTLGVPSIVTGTIRKAGDIVTSVGQTVGAIKQVYNDAKSLIPKSGGGSGTDAITAAITARCAVYLAAAMQGSIQAARYLLGWQRAEKTAFGRQMIDGTIKQLSSAAPSIMQQAMQLGPLSDTCDGLGGLKILVDQGVHFVTPGVATCTDTGAPGSQDARIYAGVLSQNAATSRGWFTPLSQAEIDQVLAYSKAHPNEKPGSVDGVQTASVGMFLGLGVLAALMLSRSHRGR